MPSTTTAKGTKVSSATSLVISMEEKKHSATSTADMSRRFPARSQRKWARAVKLPALRSPATTTIRQYSSARVRKSI